MSGSSSSGRSYIGVGGGLSGTSTEDCSSLKGTTKVMSPSMVYFSKILVGDKLKIKLDAETVILLNVSDDEVGGINPTWVTNLIDCLKKGNKYEATISKINGAAIDVTIQAE